MDLKRKVCALVGQDLGVWQFSLLHALLAMTLLSAFLSAIASRSLWATVGIGGASGVGLLVAGRRLNKGVLVVLGLGMLFLTLGALPMEYCFLVLGQGTRTLPCTVRVTDAQSGLPIPGASVRIREIQTWIGGGPLRSIPPGEPGVSGATDGSGAATLAQSFRMSCQEGYFTREETVHISPDKWLHVTAVGYDEVLAPLSQYTGTNFRYAGDASQFQNIEIQLQPKTPGGKSHP